MADWAKRMEALELEGMIEPGADEPELREVPGSIEEPDATDGAVVALIDSEERSAQLLRLCLQDNGYRVHSFQSVGDCLAGEGKQSDSGDTEAREDTDQAGQLEACLLNLQSEEAGVAGAVRLLKASRQRPVVVYGVQELNTAFELVHHDVDDLFPLPLPLKAMTERLRELIVRSRTSS